MSSQFAGVVLDLMDSQIEERNYVRQSELAKDVDFFLCSDDGLILSTIDQKRRQLEIIARFTEFAQLRITSYKSLEEEGKATELIADL